MNGIVTIALATSLLSAPMMAGPSPAQSGPRTRTEPALACLLGFASRGCRHDFFEPMVRTGPVRDCAKENLGQGACPNGYLKAVDYLGTNAGGNDVYLVKFRHGDSVYVFGLPGRDGKINGAWVTSDNPVLLSSLTEVPSDRARRMALYRRSPR
jgi:hypothetical protein